MVLASSACPVHKPASQWEQAYSLCKAEDEFPSLLRGFSDEEV